jgi:hypothetical protein
MSATDPADMPDLGPCCGCETREGVRNMVMLSRRGAVPGHGWGCVVCGLPFDGVYLVLCDNCLARWQADEYVITVACRGYPAEDGRIAIAELPEGEFDHDESKHHQERFESDMARCN